MNDLLSASELEELTGYIRPSAQIRALAKMGIKFKIRPRDGSPIVMRECIIAAMGLSAAPAPQEDGPRFDKVA